MPDREHLDVIRVNLVNDAVSKVDEFANSRLVPLRYHSTLFRKILQRSQSLFEAVEPLHSTARPVVADVVDNLAGPLDGAGGPYDPQPGMRARNCAIAASCSTPSPRASSALASLMSRMTSSSSTKAS